MSLPTTCQCGAAVVDTSCWSCGMPITEAQPAPMSRREEVEDRLKRFAKWLRDAGPIDAYMSRCETLARTLADEVDYLRATRDDRDTIIDKLIAILEPGEPVYYEHTEVEQREWVDKRRIHARACEIAGRVK